MFLALDLVREEWLIIKMKDDFDMTKAQYSLGCFIAIFIIGIYHLLTGVDILRCIVSCMEKGVKRSEHKCVMKAFDWS